jgi:hypothetical protein
VDFVCALPVAFARLDMTRYDAILVHRVLDQQWPSAVKDTLRFATSRQQVPLLGILAGCPDKKLDPPAGPRLRLRLWRTKFFAVRGADQLERIVLAAAGRLARGCEHLPHGGGEMAAAS